MKVSVIIPTHNRLKQLYRAYKSVCNQTRKPEEIIIIDDCSQKAIADSQLSFNYPDILTIIKKFDVPQGGCQARNWGATIATGDILMFLDDDDTWEREKIAAQLAVFEAHNEVGLVYSGRLIVAETNRDLILYKIYPQKIGKIYPDILYSNLIGTTSSVAIKKSLFEEVQGFDREMPALQDYDLWIRASQKTIVKHDSLCSVRYTISEQAIQQISGKYESYLKAATRVLEKYQEAISSQGFVGSRKIEAGLYFFVAKSARLQGLIPAIPFIIKSCYLYPNYKVLLLLLPTKIIYFMQGLISKYFTKIAIKSMFQKAYFSDVIVNAK